MFKFVEIMAWPVNADGWHESPDGIKIFISPGARVGARASVGDWASVGDGASVGDQISFQKSPLYIIGTRRLVFELKPGILSIGCESHSVEWWLENYVQCFRENGYNDDEIAEYKMYIDLYAARISRHEGD